MIKIAIIGGGWFGCHIAKILQEKYPNYDVHLFEKNNNILSNASQYNQNRLHLGFHYPRNKPTRKLCYLNFDKFINQYKNCIENEPLNIYSISYKSLIDFETYTDIMEKNNLKFNIENYHCYYFNTNTIEGSISTGEKIINFHKARKIFNKKIKNIHLNYNFQEKENINFDKIIYCTYYPIDTTLNCEFVPTLIWKTNLNWKISFTVMNGSFFSLLKSPQEKNNTHTLTHVEHGRIGKYSSIEEAKINITDKNKKNLTEKMLEEIKFYFKKEYFEEIYKNLSKKINCCIKTIIPSMSDSRDLYVVKNKNTIFLTCGKISGIFDAEREILQWLE
jgi:hypothetical protein